MTNLFKAKLVLYYHLRLQPSEIENMPYYEYEITIENLQELLKEKNESEKRANDEQNKGMPNYGNVAKNFKAPKMPSFRMPKI